MAVSPEMGQILEGAYKANHASNTVALAQKLNISLEEADQLLKANELGLPSPPKTASEIIERGVGAAKTGMETLGQVAKESALPALGGLGGLAVGGVPGAMAGGGLGEALNMALGISEKPESVMGGAGRIALSAGMEALPGAGRLVKTGLKKGARLIPGVRGVLKQPMVHEMESLPAKFLPKVSSKQMYGELAGLDDVKVKFPETIRVAKELGVTEAHIMPGLQSPTIKRGSTGAKRVLSSEKPEQVITSPILGPRGEPIQTVIPGSPDTGVNFTVAQDNLRRLGLAIRKADVPNAPTMEDAGMLRRLRGTMFKEMEQASEHFPKLREANRTFAREAAVEDLQAWTSNAVKAVEGKEGLVDFNATAVLNQIRKITNPKNTKYYDELFVKGIGEKNLDEMIKALDKINDFGKITFNLPGPAALVSQGILAGTGAAMGSAVMGAPGAAIGAIGGASLPHVISEALTKPSSRQFLLRALKESDGKITKTDQFLTILGAITGRAPTAMKEQ